MMTSVEVGWPSAPTARKSIAQAEVREADGGLGIDQFRCDSPERAKQTSRLHSSTARLFRPFRATSSTFSQPRPTSAMRTQSGLSTCAPLALTAKNNATERLPNFQFSISDFQFPMNSY